jgi:hypothetical protein
MDGYPETTAIDANDILNSPRWYLWKVDIWNRAALLVRMEPEDYVRSPSLGEKIERPDGRDLVVDLGDLDQILADGPALGPLDFIFHSSFCCSTYLTRAMEAADSHFVLREPMPLHQLEEDGVSLHTEARRERWDRAFDVTLRMLSRRFDPRRRTLLKVDTLSLAPLLRKRSPEGRCLFLYGDVESFAASVLKQPGRGNWARAQHARLVAVCRASDALRYAASDLPESSSDADCAVSLWVLQMRIAQHVFGSEDPARFRILDSAELERTPVQCLARIFRFFGHEIDAPTVHGLLDSASLRRHAKDAGIPFDLDRRRQERQRDTARYAAEIEASLRKFGHLSDRGLPTTERIGKSL